MPILNFICIVYQLQQVILCILQTNKNPDRVFLENKNVNEYEKMWKRKFSSRVRVAKAVHPLLWNYWVHQRLVRMGSAFPFITDLIYKTTRGKIN
jgi:hypothetical protein